VPGALVSPARAAHLAAEERQAVRGRTGARRITQFMTARVGRRVLDSQGRTASSIEIGALESGKRVGLASGDFSCFGTPEELDSFPRTGRPV
jgi:hypothetical protein